MASLRSSLRAGVVGLVLLGCDRAEPVVEQDKPASSPHGYDGTIHPRLLKRFSPLVPGGIGVREPENVASLGQKLFFDERMSKGKDLSCASCHDIANGGADRRPGRAAAPGRRDAPTVLNAAGSFAQGWDGRAMNVEDHALVPLLSPKVMGMGTNASAVARLREIPGYAPLFKEAFPDDPQPLRPENIGKALGAYERKLVTPGRWDRFLAGDRSALTPPEKEGLRTFLAIGCMVCHTGPLVGGTMFERAGVVEPWPDQSDPGRMNITKSEADRMMFKVPTLRNVTKTAPYFHDASAQNLADAVRKMGKHQLGLDLTTREVESITAWLGSLDGEAPTMLAMRPDLP